MEENGSCSACFSRKRRRCGDGKTLSVIAARCQLSRRESQDLKPVAKVLGETRKLPAVLLPLPLGEVDANVVSRRRGRTPTGFDGGSYPI